MVNRQLAIVICLALGLAACAAPRPTIKIALVAPFEGHLRQVGYDAFPAMRLAIRNAISTGGVGRYNVTFVAYNDNGDPAMAERVARAAAIDPEVVAVMGHWVTTTTLAALHVYTEAELPVLVAGVPANVVPQDALVFRVGPTGESRGSRVAGNACNAQFTLLNSQFGMCRLDAPPVSDIANAQQALAGFTDITLGTPPAPRSIVAFDATNVVLDAIRIDAQDGSVTRAGVVDGLRRVRSNGLLGTISFTADGVWAEAPIWVYRR